MSPREAFSNEAGRRETREAKRLKKEARRAVKRQAKKLPTFPIEKGSP
jgi:hypothetical protein